MRTCLQNIGAVLFLALFLPYIITLLLNGREGIHQEQELPALEYQVLYRLMQEDYSWMSDPALELMAVLYRTEIVRTQSTCEVREISFGNDGKLYSRMYQAVTDTKGQVIQINGAYQEIPYHAVSAGTTRDGSLLGEDFTYVLAADCSDDLKAESYLWICSLSKEEISQALGVPFDLAQMKVYRDSAEYVTRVICSGQEWQGEAFRTLLHLPSSCFWMEDTSRGIRVTVKGSGHGFGISLYTADRLMQEGAGIQEILDKFYQNAECITIP